MVCVVGFLSYIFVEGGIFWTLAAATNVGSIVAAPFAAMTVKKGEFLKLEIAIAVTTIILGIFILLKTFVL